MVDETLKTKRTRLRRKSDRGHYDPKIVYAILDATPLCHIGYNDNFGTPAVMPTLHWREGNHVYWHASNGARSLKAMKDQPVCLTVTMLDGLVLARSAMNHSANYRSCMIYGTAFEVSESHKEAKLANMINAYYPGRWEKLRPINEVEIKQTAVFGLEISEASAKIRDTGVIDDEEDLDWPLWSGVISVSYVHGAPVEDEHNQTGTPMGKDVKALNVLRAR